nr:unnamed protein product [Callosobruchus analis]
MEHLISPQDYEKFQQNTHLNATRDFNYEKSKLDRSTSSKNETITAESSSLDYSPCNNEFEEDKTVPQCTITKEELEEDNASASEYSDKWLTELEVDNFSSYGKESLESIKNEQLRNHLKNWACNFNITQRALKELIKIFNDRLPNVLPVDPRTLLGTPTTITIREMGEGYYWHQGLKHCLNRCHTSLQTLSKISLNVNIDGLPIYKSSKDEFWPILFNIFEVPELQPMVIGIYSRKGKPNNVEDFLTPFVEEAKLILEN